MMLLTFTSKDNLLYLPCWPVRVPHKFGGLVVKELLVVPLVMSKIVSVHAPAVAPAVESGCCKVALKKSNRIWQISKYEWKWCKSYHIGGIRYYFD